MPKIKVVQFIHGLNMGGAETLVKEYALRLDKEKFDVTILCYDRLNSPYQDILENAGIPIVYACDDLPTWGKRNPIARVINHFGLFYVVKKWLRKLEPDVVHYHLCLNRYVKYARLNQKVKLVYTQHFQISRWIKDYPKDIKAAKWLMNHYRMTMIALNDNMKDELNRIFDTNNSIVLNNGIDVHRFRYALPKNLIRQKIGIPQNAYVIGHVGRFSEIKNHKFLVEIFAEIAKKIDSAFLLMVGKGETLNSIKLQLKRLGIEDKTLILHDRTDIPDLMRSMDVMVFPSFSEGMPVTLVEAQISELPCMVSASISTATKISNLIRYMGLDETAKSWADEILAWNKEEPEYYNAEKWDINQIISQLEEIYRLN